MFKFILLENIDFLEDGVVIENNFNGNGNEYYYSVFIFVVIVIWVFKNFFVFKGGYFLVFNVDLICWVKCFVEFCCLYFYIYFVVDGEEIGIVSF